VPHDPRREDRSAVPQHQGLDDRRRSRRHHSLRQGKRRRLERLAIIGQVLARQAELEQARGRSSARFLDRQRALQAKIDRGYDDYVESRISETLWARKSAEWETELASVTAELSAIERPPTSFVATGERILELVKRAGILYKTQDPAEQRRLLDSALSNCTFDRGSVCPTYKKPFDLFAQAAETGEWRGRRDSNPRPLP
jgi:hypothetical protein